MDWCQMLPFADQPLGSFKAWYCHTSFFFQQLYSAQYNQLQQQHTGTINKVGMLLNLSLNDVECYT
jgi:hypothetical protein